MKKKKPSKQQVLANAKKQLDRVLDRTGYFALKAKHSKITLNRFSDLTVDTSGLPPLSDTIGNGLTRRSGAHHPDAIQFPVGNTHKSSLTLILKSDNLEYMSGKKV